MLITCDDIMRRKILLSNDNLVYSGLSGAFRVASRIQKNLLMQTIKTTVKYLYYIFFRNIQSLDQNISKYFCKISIIRILNNETIDQFKSNYRNVE